MKKLLLISIALFAFTIGIHAQQVTAYTGSTPNVHNFSTAVADGIFADLSAADSIVATGTWTGDQLAALRNSLKNDTYVGAANSTLQKVDFSAAVFSNGMTNLNGMAYMFYDYFALTSVTLPETVTTDMVGFRGAFYGCSSLTEINNLGRFSNISDLEQTFQGCSSLNEVRLASLSGYLGYTFDGTKEGIRVLLYPSISITDESKLPDKWQGYTNIIWIFGTEVTEHDYNIEYYYNGVKDDDLTKTGTEYIGSRIKFDPESMDESRDGYLFAYTLPANGLKISSNETANVLQLHYMPAVAYTIEYYYDNEIDNEATGTGMAPLGNLIGFDRASMNKPRREYVFSHAEPCLITDNATENVLKLYYAILPLGTISFNWGWEAPKPIEPPVEPEPIEPPVERASQTRAAKTAPSYEKAWMSAKHTERENSLAQQRTKKSARTVLKSANEDLGFTGAILISAAEDSEITIDWGDGSEPETIIGEGFLEYGSWINEIVVVHTYADYTTYDVTISGRGINSFDVWQQEVNTLTFDNCTNLQYIWCLENPLTNLDVSGCTALEILVCENTALETLDVSGCTALQELYCQNNLLETLDVSGCTALMVLEHFGNPIESLNISDTYFDYFEIYDTPSLKSLTAANCTNLEYLYCPDNALQTLDLSRCTALMDFDYSGNPLESLDISGTAFEFFDITGMPTLTSLTAANCTKLTYLDCYGNALDSLDVSGCTVLEYLDCEGNALDSLDVSGCTALEYLDCSDNALTNLGASGCTALRELYCFGNRLLSLDVSGCTELYKLSCHINQLQSLDVNDCTNLLELYCYANELNTITFENCTNLVLLACSYNQLESLDASGLDNLMILACAGNQLEELVVNSGLQMLCADHNRLTLDKLYTLAEKENGYNDLSGMIPGIAGFMEDAGYPEGASLILSPQILPAVENVQLEDIFTLATEEMNIDGTATQIAVLKNDEPAVATDYTFDNADGTIAFHTVGTYTTAMSNDAIASDDEDGVQVLRSYDVINATGIIQPTGNNGIGLWSHSGKLYISTPQATQVCVYTLNGSLMLQQNLPAGTSNCILPTGAYAVTIDGKTVKAIVK